MGHKLDASRNLYHRLWSLVSHGHILKPPTWPSGWHWRRRSAWPTLAKKIRDDPWKKAWSWHGLAMLCWGVGTFLFFVAWNPIAWFHIPTIVAFVSTCLLVHLTRFNYKITMLLGHWSPNCYWTNRQNFGLPHMFPPCFLGEVSGHHYFPICFTSSNQL